MAERAFWSSLSKLLLILGALVAMAALVVIGLVLRDGLPGHSSSSGRSGEGGAMHSVAASAADKELVERATALIEARFREGRHHIASALRTSKGEVFTGVHVEAYVGRITVCGEAVAIGAAATAGDAEIATIVAVNELGEVVAPCGMCRELIADYGASARVLMTVDGALVSVPIADLLPHKYSRSDD